MSRFRTVVMVCITLTSKAGGPDPMVNIMPSNKDELLSANLQRIDSQGVQVRSSTLKQKIEPNQASEVL